MITISIDMTKIDETRIRPFVRKNGEKAEFLELVLIESPNSMFGDYVVKQSMSKDERMAGKEMPLLGDGKTYRPPDGTHKAPGRRQQSEVF